MTFKQIFYLPLLWAVFSTSLWANNGDNQISEADIKSQISAITSDGSAEKATTQNLGSALYFIEQAKKQQQDIDDLERSVLTIPDQSRTIEKNIELIEKEVNSDFSVKFSNLSVEKLEKAQQDLHSELQSIQSVITDLNTKVTNNRNLKSNNQRLLDENSKRIQEIGRLRNASDVSKSLNDKYTAELNFIELNNRYNHLLNQYSDTLLALEELKRSEAVLKQQVIQRKLSALQTVLNDKRLKESEKKAELAESEKANTTLKNFLVQDELDHNTELSKVLLSETQKLNQLSQDNLKIKNTLENLVETKRDVDEQITALQGTLVLSKIINQQKQLLPTEKGVNNLSKFIGDLRVSLFEYSQQREAVYNINDYIKSLVSAQEEPLTKEENNALVDILQKREIILDDIIKSLTEQLSVANNIEFTQKQVIEISNSLEAQLEQQSFWVKSNNPIDFDWVQQFPKNALKEIKAFTQYIGFENLGSNLLPTLLFIFGLMAIYALIIWKKLAIKERLAVIAAQVNTLKNDSHWHTPEAMLWTVVLALPSTILFLIIYTLVVYIFFYDPLLAWSWGLTLAAYWLFFATLLSLLRPHGLAFMHFGMPQASNEIFQRIIRQSIWIVVLLVVSSVFSQVETIGFTNDMIGQVMTIIALALCLFIVRPLLDRGIQEYENAKTEDGSKRSVSLFKLLRLVLIFAPITLIVLIVLGYYYTAVYLIEHLLNSYFVSLFWVFGRYFAYRSVAISSRRMAYRRLQEKRQQIREQQKELEQGKEEIKEKSEDLIKISTVNRQIYRMADLVGWVVLFAMLYAIWSDLISVAYYLDGFVLWQNDNGTQVESVTLLNLMRTVLYIVVTYVLVKNIAGILEVTLFSRVKFSKGTPHTITAILTYTIVTLGSIFAFTSLGISWNKIQWVFTALSVGLGFGVREIFGSFVSGTILLFERPIRVGDKVTVGQYTGVISKIRLRSTTLLNSDSTEVVLPNQAFVTDRFINWTLNNTITRLQVLVRVKYGTDLKIVRQLLLQAAGEALKVMKDPAAEVNILSFNEHAIEHELLVHVAELGDRTDTTNFLYYRINQLFKDHQISMAFNQLDVHLHSDEPQAVRNVENFAK